MSEKRLLFCVECGIIKLFSGECRCSAWARAARRAVFYNFGDIAQLVARYVRNV